MEWRGLHKAYEMAAPIRIQIASGLAIHSIKKGNFSDILIPSARDLILAGGILKAGDPVNGKFAKYLLDNWSRVFYVEGISERMGNDIPLEDYHARLTNYRRPAESPIGKLPTGSMLSFLGAPMIPWEVESRRTQDIAFIKDRLHWLYSRKYILASAGSLPRHILSTNVAALVQGVAERNQFDPTLGPVVNSRTNPNGTRRRSYRPNFVLELR